MTQELSQTSLLLLGLFSLLSGFCSGAFYDLFRIRRRASRGKKNKKLLTRLFEGFIIGLEDLVFFIMLGCVLSVLFHLFSYGKVRFVAIIALFIGFWLYRISIGKLVMGVADAVIAFVRLVKNALIAKIIRPVISPLVKAYGRICGSLAEKKAKKAELKKRKKYAARRKKRLVDPSNRANMLNH